MKNNIDNIYIIYIMVNLGEPSKTKPIFFVIILIASILLFMWFMNKFFPETIPSQTLPSGSVSLPTVTSPTIATISVTPTAPTVSVPVQSVTTPVPVQSVTTPATATTGTATTPTTATVTVPVPVPVPVPVSVPPTATTATTAAKTLTVPVSVPVPVLTTDGTIPLSVPTVDVHSGQGVAAKRTNQTTPTTVSVVERFEDIYELENTIPSSYLPLYLTENI